jgi:hypothetical protein
MTTSCPTTYCGQRCVTSPVSSVVNGVSVPPDAGMRDNPPSGVAAMMIESSDVHVAPRLRETVARFNAVPPLTGIFRSAFGVTHPIHSPLGEKNGLYGVPVSNNDVPVI